MRRQIRNRFTVFLFVLLVFNGMLVIANDQQIDSLKTVNSQLENKEEIADNYVTISVLYNISNNESSLHYAQLAYNLASEINYPNGMADALFQISYCYDKTGEWEEAIENLNQAVEIYKELKDTADLIGSYLNIGLFYSYGTDLVKGLEYFIEAKNLIDEANETYGLPEAYTNIGWYYEYLEDYRNAYRYNQKSLESIVDQNNSPDFVCMIQMNQGYLNLKLQQFDEAFDNLQKAKDLLPELEDMYMETEMATLFATYYLETEQLKLAEQEINKAEKLIYEQDYERLRPDFYAAKGLLLLKKKKYNDAIKSLNTAIEYCENLEKFDALSAIYANKTEAYAQLGQYEKAYEMLQLQNQTNEMIQPNKIAKVLGEFEREELLKEERAQLELQRQLETEKSRSKAYREKVQLQVTALSSVMLIIILIIVSYYAILRRKHGIILKENYDTINKQKVLLESNLKQLAEDEEKLKQLNATKDKFFSIIAHDLKNPFNVMIGISDLIRSNADIKHTKEFETMVDGMFEAATSGYNLLENLLEWSRTQTESIQFKPENFSIIKVCTANKTLFKEPARTKNIEIIWPSVDIEVFADYNMVNFIFRNLIGNAIKFSNTGGKIEVLAKASSKMLQCTIKDSGIGMDEDTISKLFKIEHSVQKEGTANEKGTGLGLILCKEFVEKNEGTITVESKVGVGSSFTFYLPLKKSVN